MKSSEPIQAIFHYPKDSESRQALCNQIADLHAEYILAFLSQKSCPAEQKLALLDAVIHAAKTADPCCSSFE